MPIGPAGPVYHRQFRLCLDGTLEPGMPAIGKPFPLNVHTSKISDMVTKDVSTPAL
jgi:hypothetical protein